MSRETGTLFSVFISEAWGHENLDLLPKQFFSTPTKNLFGLSIHPNDLANLIDNDHGIRGCLQKIAELSLTLTPPKQGLDRSQQLGGFHRMCQEGFVSSFQMSVELAALDRMIR